MICLLRVFFYSIRTPSPYQKYVEKIAVTKQKSPTTKFEIEVFNY